MNKINWGRVLLGGIVAGIVSNAIEYVLHTYVIAGQENAAMQAMGAKLMNGAIPIFMALGIVTGIAAVWLYAAVRPRYGAGAGTAAIAGLGVWVIGYAVPDIAVCVEGLYPIHLTGVALVVGLVEIILATVVGAALYKE